MIFFCLLLTVASHLFAEQSSDLVTQAQQALNEIYIAKDGATDAQWRKFNVLSDELNKKLQDPNSPERKQFSADAAKNLSAWVSEVATTDKNKKDILLKFFNWLKQLFGFGKRKPSALFAGGDSLISTAEASVYISPAEQVKFVQQEAVRKRLANTPAKEDDAEQKKPQLKNDDQLVADNQISPELQKEAERAALVVAADELKKQQGDIDEKIKLLEQNPNPSAEDKKVLDELKKSSIGLNAQLNDLKNGLPEGAFLMPSDNEIFSSKNSEIQNWLENIEMPQPNANKNKKDLSQGNPPPDQEPVDNNKILGQKKPAFLKSAKQSLPIPAPTAELIESQSINQRKASQESKSAEALSEEDDVVASEEKIRLKNPSTPNAVAAELEPEDGQAEAGNRLKRSPVIKNNPVVDNQAEKDQKTIAAATEKRDQLSASIKELEQNQDKIPAQTAGLEKLKQQLVVQENILKKKSSIAGSDVQVSAEIPISEQERQSARVQETVENKKAIKQARGARIAAQKNLSAAIEAAKTAGVVIDQVQGLPTKTIFKTKATISSGPDIVFVSKSLPLAKLSAEVSSRVDTSSETELNAGADAINQASQKALEEANAEVARLKAQLEQKDIEAKASTEKAEQQLQAVQDQIKKNEDNFKQVQELLKRAAEEDPEVMKKVFAQIASSSQENSETLASVLSKAIEDAKIQAVAVAQAKQKQEEADAAKDAEEKQRLNESQAEISKLQESLKALDQDSEEAVQIKKQIAELQKTSEQLNASVSQRSESKKTADQKLADLKQKQLQLQTQLEESNLAAEAEAARSNELQKAFEKLTQAKESEQAAAQESFNKKLKEQEIEFEQRLLKEKEDFDAKEEIRKTELSRVMDELQSARAELVRAQEEATRKQLQAEMNANLAQLQADRLKSELDALKLQQTTSQGVSEYLNGKFLEQEAQIRRLVAASEKNKQAAEEKIASAKEELEKKSMELEDQKAKIAALENANAGLQKSLKESEDRVGKLNFHKEQFVTKEQDSRLAKEIAQRERDDFRFENSRLRKLSESLQKKIEQQNDLEKQLSSLQAENAESKKALQEAQAKLESASAENQKQLQESTSKIVELENQAAQSKLETERLASELETSKKQVADAQETLAKQKISTEKFAARLLMNAAKSAQLQKTISQQEEQVKSMQDQLATQQDLSASQKSDLQSQLDTVKKDLETKNADLDAVKKEKDSLQQNLEQAKKDQEVAQANKESVDANLAKLNADLAKAQAEKQAIEVDRQKAKEAFDQQIASQRDEFGKQISELSQQIGSKDETIAKQLAEIAEKSESQAKLQKQLGEMSGQLAAMQKEQDVSQRQLAAQKQELDDQRKKLNDSFQAAQLNLIDSETRIRQALSDQQDAEFELLKKSFEEGRLNLEVQAARGKEKQDFEIKLAQVSAEKQALQKSVEEFQKRAQSTRDENAKLSAELNELTTQKKELEGKVAESNQTSKELEKANNDLSYQIQQAQLKLEDSKRVFDGQFKGFLDERELKDTEILDQQKTILLLQQQITVLNGNKQKFEDARARLHGQIDGLQEKILELQNNKVVVGMESKKLSGPGRLINVEPGKFLEGSNQKPPINPRREVKRNASSKSESPVQSPEKAEQQDNRKALELLKNYQDAAQKYQQAKKTSDQNLQDDKLIAGAQKEKEQADQKLRLAVAEKKSLEDDIKNLQENQELSLQLDAKKKELDAKLIEVQGKQASLDTSKKVLDGAKNSFVEAVKKIDVSKAPASAVFGSKPEIIASYKTDTELNLNKVERLRDADKKDDFLQALADPDLFVKSKFKNNLTEWPEVSKDSPLFQNYQTFYLIKKLSYNASEAKGDLNSVKALCGISPEEVDKILEGSPDALKKALIKVNFAKKYVLNKKSDIPEEEEVGVVNDQIKLSGGKNLASGVTTSIKNYSTAVESYNQAKNAFDQVSQEAARFQYQFDDLDKKKVESDEKVNSVGTDVESLKKSSLENDKKIEALTQQAKEKALTLKNISDDLSNNRAKDLTKSQENLKAAAAKILDPKNKNSVLIFVKEADRTKLEVSLEQVVKNGALESDNSIEIIRKTLESPEVATKLLKNGSENQESKRQVSVETILPSPRGQKEQKKKVPVNRTPVANAWDGETSRPNSRSSEAQRVSNRSDKDKLSSSATFARPGTASSSMPLSRSYPPASNAKQASGNRLPPRSAFN